MDKKYDDLRSEYFLSSYEIDNIFRKSIDKLNSNIDKQMIFQRLQLLANDLDKNKGSFIEIINMIKINVKELDELDKLVDFNKFHITDLKDIKNTTAKNYIEKN